VFTCAKFVKVKFITKLKVSILIDVIVVLVLDSLAAKYSTDYHELKTTLFLDRPVKIVC
jgi:hypothetical protein